MTIKTQFHVRFKKKIINPAYPAVKQFSVQTQIRTSYSENMKFIVKKTWNWKRRQHQHQNRIL